MKRNHYVHRNIRLWHLTHRGHFVRLTIRPSKPVTIASQWHNGEGGSWSADTYEIEDACLINTWAEGGSDCDGSHRSGGVLICYLTETAVRPSCTDPSVLLPAWLPPLPGWQRDQFAESANY